MHDVTPDEFREAQELFLRAVEIDEPRRADWLDEQCIGNDTLKNQVLSLLAHDDTRTLVQVAVTGPLASTIAQTQPVATVRKFTPALKSIPARGLIALGALAVLLPVLLYGVIAEQVLERFRNGLRASTLVELVDAKSTGIRFWLEREQTIVQSWADSTKVRQLITELIDVSAKSTPDQTQSLLRDAPQQSLLDKEMESLADHPVRYAVWDSRLITIADWSPNRLGVGVGVTPKGAQRLTAVLQGRAEAFVIGPDDTITIDYSEMPKKPILGIMVPVSDEAGKVIAALLVYDTGAEKELGEFIRLSSGVDAAVSPARVFVFDHAGLLLYDSPFDAQLRTLGLIPDEPESFSAKRFVLRDPGVDLTRGQVLSEPIAARPRTKMVRMATSEGAGFDVDGYRDARGVPVAGAWRWLDDYQFGIGIEIDKDALQPAMWLARIQSWLMLGLLGTSLGVVGYSMLTIRRLRTQVQAEHRIGPYQLDRMVGEGGMGQVFKAHHDLLKRPTAVKLLRPELIDEQTKSRFQREAQLAARLEHPNTVSIYDFGVTDENVCYLVMEWIAGPTLDQLVARSGPLPIDRAVNILRQIAMSLREAQVLGLIHRDLKPQNVMVTERAGESDVVKVLDFGLARDVLNPQATMHTAPGLIAGTPRYMAPERWDAAQRTTASVDVYAFGCIAYFILTASEANSGDSISEICASVLSTKPKYPSTVVGDVVPKWLEELTVQCMANEPSQRPASFTEILKAM